MYKLGDYLNQLIEERGTNKYQISKNAKLDRTTLQRTLTGERLPKVEFILKLCDYLNVSPIQREEVLRLYEIQKIGPGVYENREYIKSILEELAVPLHKTKVFDSLRSIDIGNINKMEIVEQSYKIQSVISNILEDELLNNNNAKIRTTVPFEFRFLFDLFKSLCSNSLGSFSIEHIVKLDKNPLASIDSNYNLRVVSSIMPLAFLSSGIYTPYYYYGLSKSIENDDIPFPYYLITSKFLVLISSKFDKIIIHVDKSILTLYESLFENSKNNCMNLLKRLNTTEEILGSYLSQFSKSKSISIIGSQPSIGICFNNSYVSQKIKEDFPYRDEFLKGACAFYNTMKICEDRIVSLFTKEGLEYFAKYGHAIDIPKDCIYQITKEERLWILDLYCKEIENDKINSRCINVSKIQLSEYSALVISDEKVTIANSDRDEYLIICNFTESSIVEAFVDFANYMKDSDMVYSKDETIRVIEEVIDKYLIT